MSLLLLPSITPHSVVNTFTYLGSNITNTASLDTKIGQRICDATTNISKNSQQVGKKPKHTIPTKMAVYQACLIWALLHRSGSGSSTQHRRKTLTFSTCNAYSTSSPFPGKTTSTNYHILEGAGIPLHVQPPLPETPVLEWPCPKNGQGSSTLNSCKPVQGKRPVRQRKLYF